MNINQQFDLSTYFKFIKKFLIAGSIIGLFAFFIIKTIFSKSFYETEYTVKLDYITSQYTEALLLEDEFQSLIYSPDIFEETIKSLAKRLEVDLNALAPNLSSIIANINNLKPLMPKIALKVSSNSKFLSINLKLGVKTGNTALPNYFVDEFNKHIISSNKRNIRIRTNTILSISNELASLTSTGSIHNDSTNSEHLLKLIHDAIELHDKILRFSDSKPSKAGLSGPGQSNFIDMKNTSLLIHPLLHRINSSYILPSIDKINELASTTNTDKTALKQLENKAKNLLDSQMSLYSTMDSDRIFNENLIEKVSTNITNKLYSDKTISTIPTLIPLPENSFMQKTFEKQSSNYLPPISAFFVGLFISILAGNVLFFKGQIKSYLLRQ